ncbi:helix-turn-helix domain-containing protein [Brevibacillus reuszeri]|uniref:helix-turn-helix domain-containing protein n=1 Tax=Brevibacillus reuszeri TaxID=54915 RepID=UPI00366E474A
MSIKEQVLLSNDTAIKLLDVKRGSMFSGNALPNYCLPANVLLFVSRGYGELSIDGTNYTISPFFVCHAGRSAAIDFVSVGQPLEYIAIYYRAELMPPDRGEAAQYFDGQNLLQVQFGVSLAERLSLYQIVEQIEQKWSMRQGLEGFHANALLQGLLYELLKQLQNDGYQHPSEAVSTVMKYIDAHYNQQLRLNQLAELVHSSSRQLQRWFKQQKQIGPMEYVIKIRMKHAAQLLQHTAATIHEIAESIGYRNAFYFSRAFKKYYGFSPLYYRQAVVDDKKHGLVIKHVKGELYLRQSPKRMVVLDVQYADQLITLNERPVGSVGIGGSVTCFPKYLQDKLGQTEVLGTYEQPNIEAISLLQPDLIVCTETHEQHYEQLSRLAPTVMFQRNENWRLILGIFGMLTDKTEEANQILLEYREKADRLSTELANTLRGQRVALIRPRDASIRVHTAAHRTGAVLYEDLGLPAPFFVTEASDTAYHISLDVLPEVHADHYFLLSNDMFRDWTNTVQDSTEWRSLSAVKQQCVYTVDSSVWIGSYGPTGINRILDEVAHYLLYS